MGKPCPFCGGKGLLDRTLRDGRKDGDLEAWAYFIRCHSCAAQGGWGKSEGSAWHWWNMRTTTKEE